MSKRGKWKGIGGVIGRAANNTFSGSGNLALPYSCIDCGGNTGTILLNGGADNCPKQDWLIAVMSPEQMLGGRRRVAPLQKTI